MKLLTYTSENYSNHEIFSIIINKYVESKIIDDWSINIVYGELSSDSGNLYIRSGEIENFDIAKVFENNNEFYCFFVKKVGYFVPEEDCVRFILNFSNENIVSDDKINCKDQSELLANSDYFDFIFNL
jgi:hypothetical protein